MVPGGRPLIAIGYKCNTHMVLFLFLQITQEARMQVLSIYLSTLISFLMFSFALLLVPLSYIGCFIY